MTKSILTSLDFGGAGSLTGLASPLLASDAANKSYVDANALRGIILPQTRALVQAMTNEPRRALTFAYDTLIAALIDAGVWANLGLLYILATQDAQTACLNLISPGTGNLTPTSSPTFTAYQGYAGDGAASYLDTGVQLRNVAGVSANGLCLGEVSRTNLILNTAFDVGLLSNTTARLNPGMTASTMNARLNETNGSAAPITSSIGFFAGSRVSSTEVDDYVGSGAASAPTQTVTSDTANATVVLNNVTLLRSNTNFSSRQLSAAFVGGGLTQTQMNALYAALKVFLSTSTVNAWL